MLAEKLYFALLFCITSCWEYRTLQHIPRAICSDGSPGRFIFDLYEGSTEWLLFLPGGAACNNAKMCQERKDNYPWLSTSTLQNGGCCQVAGIFNRDCSRNPLFCRANLIYITYCSSDLWSGDGEFTLENGNPFYFRGSPIVFGVLESLMPYFQNATSFFLSGNSAGGMASFIHADRVNNFLSSRLKRVLPVKAIIDSGIFLPDPVFKPLECIKTMRCGAEKSWKQGLKIWNSQLNEDCVADYQNQPWKCLEGLIAVKYLKVPTFVMMHKNDPFQPMIDGINKKIQSQAQEEYLKRRKSELEQGLDRLHQAGISLFISDCEFHSILLFEEEFLENEVQGKTAAKALFEWARNNKQLYVSGGSGQVCSDSKTVFSKHRKIFREQRPLI